MARRLNAPRSTKEEVAHETCLKPLRNAHDRSGSAGLNDDHRERGRPQLDDRIADFHGLLFGLNVGQGDNLLVADPGAGPTRLDPDDGDTALIASLPGVSDVLQVGRREYLVLTSRELGGAESALYRVKNGDVTLVADLLAWELANDFDQSGNVPGEDAISNPFDLAKLSRNKSLVADAAGNSIHVVNNKTGEIEWVATLPYEMLDGIPADPVATTVDVGPDGDIYAGELKGFLATPGMSRVWEIERDARGVACDVNNDEDDGCTLVNTPPFTSIVDIKFEDGTAYVVEIDEASWLEAGGPGALGGTVNACRSSGGDGDDDDNGNETWTCEEIATGLPFPLAVAIDDESVYVTLALGEQGPVEVAQLTTANGNGDEEEHDEDDD